MSKHLTFDDRLEIQAGLREQLNFTQIAERIGKSRTTVSREVLAHRRLTFPRDGNKCKHRYTCNQPLICRNHCQSNGFKTCKTSCSTCNRICAHFVEEHCTRYDKQPYVCNGCSKRGKCHLAKMLYDARQAQSSYKANFSESRKGISLSEAELEYLDQVISDGIKRGLSVSVIWNEHKDEMPVSVKTIYSYIDCGLLTADNTELRLKLRRPMRKKSGPTLKVDRKCCVGRTYDKFLEYQHENPDVPVVQMDSVVGKKSGKVLLTIFFSNCDLQLMYLRDRNTAASVTAIFKSLRETLGIDRYKAMFPVILTDRGSEFSDPGSIEVDPSTGEIITRVFYCDPMNSNQKSNCERNHELIRYVIPKGVALDPYSPEQIELLMNHINSYPRKKWNGFRPIDVFIKIYGEEAANLLGLKKIPFFLVNLTPMLLN